MLLSLGRSKSVRFRRDGSSSRDSPGSLGEGAVLTNTRSKETIADAHSGAGRTTARRWLSRRVSAHFISWQTARSCSPLSSAVRSRSLNACDPPDTDMPSHRQARPRTSRRYTDRPRFEPYQPPRSATVNETAVSSSDCDEVLTRRPRDPCTAFYRRTRPSASASDSTLVRESAELRVRADSLLGRCMPNQ
jgi:hypothetical protein